MERRVLEISWAGLWRILFFLVFTLLLFLGRRIFLGLFLAVVISSGLEFMVNFLEKRGVPRTVGVILIFLFGAVLVVLITYIVIPLIVVDLNTALSHLGEPRDAWWQPFFRPETTQSVSAFVDRISRQFLWGAASPLGAFSEVVGGVILAVAILVSAFYLSLSRDGVGRFIRAVFPADYEEAALRIYDRSRKRIGLWFRTQILLSFLVGLMVLIALLLLKVKYAFLLALFAAVFELVPFVGPIISGSAAVLAALTTSSTLALTTLIVFLVIQQIENHILVPLLIGRHVGLHPVIVIIALLIGAEAGGILGFLVSIPAAVVFQEIIEDWSSKKRPRQLSLA